MMTHSATSGACNDICCQIVVTRVSLGRSKEVRLEELPQNIYLPLYCMLYCLGLTTHWLFVIAKS